MKKEYHAPIIEYLAFSAYEMLAAEGDSWPDSLPYNDEELGWT